MLEKSPIPYDTMSTTSEKSSSESILNHCCLCIPLRVGCFVLGYTSLFINSLRTVFTLGVALYCGIGSHEYAVMDDENEQGIKRQMMDQESLQALAWILVAFTIFDLIWLAINIACLVGIHKKRPGPIRVFIGVATVRLILTLAGYVYGWSAYPGANLHSISAHCFELTLTAYFIFVYYRYAVKLEREAAESSAPQIPQLRIHDVSFIYPSKLDKEHLVL